MKLFQVEFWDVKARVYRAVQLSPGAAPPSLDQADAEEFSRIVSESVGSGTRIVPAPAGSQQTYLADLREKFSDDHSGA